MPTNKIIKVTTKGLELDAVLVRERYPKLAVCQDRVVQLNDKNQVIAEHDLLGLEWEKLYD